MKAIPAAWRRIASALADGRALNAAHAALGGDTENLWFVVTAGLEERFGIVAVPAGDGLFRLKEADRVELRKILDTGATGWDVRGAQP